MLARSWLHRQIHEAWKNGATMVELDLIVRAALARDGARRGKRNALVAALRQAIHDGALLPGAVLPASRALADGFGLGRNTVVGAYEQLVAEGYLRADRQGTVVGASMRATPSAAAAPRLARSRAATPELSRRAASLPGTHVGDESPLPFLPGVPALDRFPIERWRRTLAAAWRSVGPASLAGRGAEGEPVLRAAIAAHLRSSRGVRCTPEQIQVTSGTQEGMGLCAHLLAEAGDRVWIENPGYIGARAAFGASGLELVGVRLDGEGLAPTREAWRLRPPRLIYATPSHQYPTGTVMSLARRTALLEAASRAGAWVLEDDYDSEFCHGVPLAAMQGLAGDAPVVYLGTFSKTLYPALRLGFVVWPGALLERVQSRLGHLAGVGRVAEQEALAAFIHDGHFATHLRRMRALYAERQAALRAALDACWPWATQVGGGDAGMHLVVSLPAAVKDTEVVAEALARGLQPQALSACCLPGRAPANGLVLGYANIEAARMADGVRTLAAAARAVARRSARSRSSSHTG